MEHKEQIPLKWPEGWGRTLIDQRKPRSSWKKPFSYYRDAAILELERMGVAAATISRNPPHQERVDPGVAVWFSLKPADDFSWQTGLHLDTPMPTKDEIEKAYRELARKHHPDAVNQGSGGDIQVFYRLTEYRKKALAWIAGSDAPVLDNCIPCDRFIDQRQNLAAVASALRHFRGLETLGIPAILERVMDRAFKTALPSPGGDHAAAAT